MIDLPPTGDRSRTPSAQMTALLILSAGSLGLMAVIIYVVAYGTPPEPVRLMLAGFAGTLLTIPLSIAGYFFGSSLPSQSKSQTIADLASSKDPAS